MCGVCFLFCIGDCMRFIACFLFFAGCVCGNVFAANTAASSEAPGSEVTYPQLFSYNPISPDSQPSSLLSEAANESPALPSNSIAQPEVEPDAALQPGGIKAQFTNVCRRWIARPFVAAIVAKAAYRLIAGDHGFCVTALLVSGVAATSVVEHFDAYERAFLYTCSRAKECGSWMRNRFFQKSNAEQSLQ
jgi:hypothetical protein